jgi:hypothetical protein
MFTSAPIECNPSTERHLMALLRCNASGRCAVVVMHVDIRPITCNAHTAVHTAAKTGVVALQVAAFTSAPRECDRWTLSWASRAAINAGIVRFFLDEGAGKS